MPLIPLVAKRAFTRTRESLDVPVVKIRAIFEDLVYCALQKGSGFDYGPHGIRPVLDAEPRAARMGGFNTSGPRPEVPRRP